MMMGDRRLEESERLALKRRLADQLRAAIEAASERDLTDGDLLDAVATSESLNEQLVGPHRTRWYEADPADTSLRLSYLDHSPIRGPYNAIAPQMQIDIVEGEDGVRRMQGSARLSSAYEGPPHGVHGGWVAALLDELLGSAQRLTQKQGVTATLKIRYRNITPIDEELRFSAWVHEDRGRVLIVRGTCHAGDTLTADAEGMFVRIQFDEIRDRMRERARPDEGSGDGGANQTS
jgi:acyl-coenzyme A thioesterase PaaI-like protein